MWLFTSKAAVSIVTKDCDDNERLIRSRYPEDIHELFPDAKVFIDEDADYPYRAFLPAKQVAEVVANYVINSMGYDNFKNSDILFT